MASALAPCLLPSVIVELRLAHRLELEALTLQRLPVALLVVAGFLGGAMPIEIWYFPGRAVVYLAVYAVELAICAGAYVAARRWRSHARALATAWAALIALCVCGYYPIVAGDATLAMAAEICLIAAVPSVLPLGLAHLIVFGACAVLGFFGIVAWGVPMSLPWPYIFIAFLAVMSLSGIGAHTLASFRWQAFEREAILREAHEQLRSALTRAHAAVALRDQLVASVSHELRTPLNVILGYSDMLVDAKADATTVADAAPRIRSYAVALEHLVSDLLDLSRLSCGKVTPTFEDVELAPLLDEVARGAHTLVGDKPVEVAIERTLERCRSDRTRLYQILNNLACNAAKFTSRGTIVLRARREHDRAVFEVCDTGCGIPAAKHQAIFTAFEQLAPGVKNGGGMGLGLAIVRQLTEILGGTVTVASAPGEGSTFTVTLPGAAREPTSMTAAADDRPATDAPGHDGARAHS